MLIRSEFTVFTPLVIRMACGDFGYRSVVVGSLFALINVFLEYPRIRYNYPVLDFLNRTMIIPIHYSVLSSFCYNGMAHIILDNNVRSCVTNAVTTFFIERNAGSEYPEYEILLGCCATPLFSAFIKYRGYHLILGERYFMPVLLDLVLRAIPIFVFMDTKDRKSDRLEVFQRMIGSLVHSSIYIARDCFYDFLLPLDTTSPIRWLLPDAFIKGVEKYVDPYIAEFTFASPIER